jgi:hypothetical protein
VPERSLKNLKYTFLMTHSPHSITKQTYCFDNA